MGNLLLRLPTPIVVWGSFFVAGIFVYLAAAFARPASIERKALVKCFVAGDWSHKSAVTDLIAYVIGKITGLLQAGLMPIITLSIAGVFTGGIHYFFPAEHFFHANILIFLCCALILIFFSDFSGWLSHVAQHYVPVLWELHKVHHSALFLNPLTARRGHTFGILFDDVAHACIMGPPTGLLIVIFNLNPVEITLLGAFANKFFFMITLEALQHSHYPINFGFFDRIFISPHMHQIHHSSRPEHWDKNFGYIFSLWDWLFKTAYRPKRGEVIVYGIGEGETAAYQGFYGVYVLPMIGMWRVITRKTPNATGRPKHDRRYSPAGILWRDPAAAPMGAIE